MGRGWIGKSVREDVFIVRERLLMRTKLLVWTSPPDIKTRSLNDPPIRSSDISLESPWKYKTSRGHVSAINKPPKATKCQLRPNDVNCIIEESNAE